MAGLHRSLSSICHESVRRAGRWMTRFFGALSARWVHREVETATAEIKQKCSFDPAKMRVRPTGISNGNRPGFSGRAAIRRLRCSRDDGRTRDWHFRCNSAQWRGLRRTTGEVARLVAAIGLAELEIKCVWSIPQTVGDMGSPSHSIRRPGNISTTGFWKMAIRKAK